MELPILIDAIECSCEVCVSACHHKPGWFLPEEIKPAADYLNLSEKEFFDKYLSIDFWSDPELNKFVLAPATDKSSPGEIYPLDPTGRCVFLTDDNKCKIHAVKPYECKSYDHRGKSQLNLSHEAVANSWNTQQDYITALYGKTPSFQSDPEELLEFMLKTLFG